MEGRANTGATEPQWERGFDWQCACKTAFPPVKVWLFFFPALCRYYFHLPQNCYEMCVLPLNSKIRMNSPLHQSLTLVGQGERQRSFDPRCNLGLLRTAKPCVCPAFFSTISIPTASPALLHLCLPVEFFLGRNSPSLLCTINGVISRTQRIGIQQVI